MPREGHDPTIPAATLPIAISIHVPREGHDPIALRLLIGAIYFNPRAPRGARPIPGRRDIKLNGDFNPRAPRGARRVTNRLITRILNFNPRAPRGARPISARQQNDAELFQSTCPARGTTAECGSTISARQQFQSTCPARGTTQTKHNQVVMRSISIHVPREGHDHRHQYRGGETLKFQSTCPARGTTHRTETLDRRDLFQSTCPARGTTNINILLIKQAGYFNPRAPRGARPGDATVDGSDTGISIHVPREGHDIAMNLLKEMIFNISIHVPREGHDSLQLGSRMMPSYFNPRAPRGARP